MGRENEPNLTQSCHEPCEHNTTLCHKICNLFIDKSKNNQLSLHWSMDIPVWRSPMVWTASIDCLEWNMWQKDCWITEAVLQTRPRKTLCAVPAQREPTVMWTTMFPAAKIIQGESQCYTLTVYCSNFTIDRVTDWLLTNSQNPPTQLTYD